MTDYMVCGCPKPGCVHKILVAHPVTQYVCIYNIPHEERLEYIDMIREEIEGRPRGNGLEDLEDIE